MYTHTHTHTHAHAHVRKKTVQLIALGEFSAMQSNPVILNPHTHRISLHYSTEICVAYCRKNGALDPK